MEKFSEKEFMEASAALAADWLIRAEELLTSEEKDIQDQMHRLLTHPVDKVVLTKMIDESFRPRDSDRVAERVKGILKEHGVPDFFSGVEKLLMQMFIGMGRHLSSITVPKMIEKMRHDSSRAVIPGESGALHEYLHKRYRQGVRVNINHLGEAVLGEREAARRLATYITDMQDPSVEYISVKISTIYSQIHPLAFETTVDVLVDRLSRLYREARSHSFRRADGERIPKFVNLDMEEYRDLEITYEAFVRTLDQDEFKNHSAGIVLQAYLPDSFDMQKRLTRWAMARVAAGGAPVKLRIVKGANMEMELLESALFNWPPAPYDNKLDVDANYKRMVVYGMRPEHIQAVNLGIGSHNLFELAFAQKVAEAYAVTDHFYFEMLEGMADHVRRALKEKSGDVLLYAPVASKEEFINAIAYLIRRLDENTAPENFLRYAPHLRVGSRDWEFLKGQFFAACRHRETVHTAPHRTQDRRREVIPEKTGTFWKNEFVNEPDTDWSLKANRKWAASIRNKWKKGSGDAPLEIPLVVAGEEIFSKRDTSPCMDPNQYHDKVWVARFAMATAADIDRAVAAAKGDPDGWRDMSPPQRHAVLSRVAVEIRRARGDFIGAAAANTGKIFTETDVEVSEAVDFAEFYPYSAGNIHALEGTAAQAKGAGVVISPWNFPVAIPCGGITASLSAGNTVIFKPSSDAVLVAWILCRCFWRAGVSKNTLQFMPCEGSSVGTRLSGHPDVDFIILTGGTRTGLQILRKHPDLYLAAETGGKNATIVTDMADRDQAIKNVLYSAFGNSGQKCSATSLLILEKPVYEDVHFKTQLVDAARSLSVGSAWNFENRMAPLIRPPAGKLEKALSRLNSGETWALKPRMCNDNPHMWTPGIKYGVQPGSETHLTEFFGPLLGVMRADSLDHAIDLVNRTGYGLTSGLESLDPGEHAHWKRKVRAGNLYINRGTTGAITLRQPFGGMGKSALGPGLKAGSPDYVTQFMRFEERGYPKTGVIQKNRTILRTAQQWRIKAKWGRFPEHGAEIYKIYRAVKSYIYQMERKFSLQEDYFHLRGQDNILRYLPVGRVVVRLAPEDTLFDVMARIAAVRISGCSLRVSLPKGLRTGGTEFLFSADGRQFLGDAPVVFEDERALIDSLADVNRIRYAAPDRVPSAVYAAAAKTGFYIARSPVVMEGRIELLQYFRQQSICNNYHRYGNLGDRELREI